MKGIAILGATGSIGQSTLKVIALQPESYRVISLSAHTDVAGMVQLCQRFQPEIAAMADEQAAQQLAQALRAQGLKTTVLAGEQGLIQAATHAEVDMVMAAIVGAAGLMPTLAAVQAGKTILLANKEVLVMAGPLFMQAVVENGVRVLPIDSEHNAVFQCLPPDFNRDLAAKGIIKIMLTASGGPFRRFSQQQLTTVTPEQAIVHPNWRMGKKISVDSATMMNKGLEVIEAHWLFGARPDQIEVVVHPQSIIHSMVQYRDGSVLAQLGHPDMRTPIAHALAWPERMEAGVPLLDLFKVKHLDFEAADTQRFPCLKLAYEAIKAGGTLPAVLNAANEVAVAAFLAGRIRFIQIAELIASVMDKMAVQSISDLKQLMTIDAEARRLAQAWIESCS